MHTVVETRAYLSTADDVGMTEDERAAIVSTLSRSADRRRPARLRRCAKTSREKARHRQIGRLPRDHLLCGRRALPVFVLTVFGKTEKTSLNKAERNALATLTSTLADSLTRRHANDDRADTTSTPTSRRT